MTLVLYRKKIDPFFLLANEPINCIQISVIDMNKKYCVAIGSKAFVQVVANLGFRPFSVVTFVMLRILATHICL